MCSIGDDIGENSETKFMVEKEKINLLETKCNKCRDQVPCILLRGKDVYCKQCFLNGTVHKFKALLGKHRIIHPNDNILVCHEPGHASAALLHFLRSGLNLDTPKKLRFKPIFLFIDKYVNLNVTTRNKLKEDTNRQLMALNFPIYFVSLYSFIKNTHKLSELLTTDPKQIAVTTEIDLQELEKVIDLKTTETTRNEIFNIWQNDLLIAAAKILNCKFVFTPELSVDVASQMLTSLSLGRGFHIAYDTGFCDSRNSDVKILRPLRVFEEKELAFYNIYNKVETIHIPIIQPENPFSSIQNLLKKFVNELQMNYPATIATVVRTGDKLTVDNNIQLNRKCRLCKAPLELPSEELTAEKATDISQWISTHTELEIENSINENNLTIFNSVNKNAQCCYSCSKIEQFMK